jgi:hypothetical protein
VISAKARAADRCKSTLSLKERVVSAAKGEPVKKLVVVRSVLHQRTDRCTVLVSAGDKCGRVGGIGSLSRYCSKSATASRSFSNSNGSYAFFLRGPPACVSYIHIYLTTSWSGQLTAATTRASHTVLGCFVFA